MLGAWTHEDDLSASGLPFLMATGHKPKKEPCSSFFSGMINARGDGWWSSVLSLNALVTALRAHAQFLTSLLTTCTQNIAPIGRRHALTEAVLVASLAYRGLKGPFHIDTIECAS